ncbi:mechanosensitive ion channel [bacterium]|nr:mechanosensitive ion channel [bacterium]
MPEQITGWGAAAWAATGAALSNLLGWIPHLIGAIVVLLVGWWIASVLGKLTDRGLDAIHFDRWMARAHVDEAIARSGMRIEPSNLVGNLVKWLVFLVAILVASDALGLPQVTAALNSVIGYIPNVIAAVLILGFGAVLAAFVHNLVRSAPVTGSRVLGQVAYYAVLVFAVMAALTQLNIAPALIQTLFTALIGAVALAGALAFGLGLRHQAADLVTSASVLQLCKVGESLSLKDEDGTVIAGRIEAIGPTMTRLATDEGSVLVPNRQIAEGMTTLYKGGIPSRITVTRLPEELSEQPSREPPL